MEKLDWRSACRMGLVLAFALNAGTCRLRGGSPVLVGKQVPASQKVALGVIQHDAWTALLQKYVDQQGNVNYKAWKANAASIQALDNYLAHLSKAKIGSRNSVEAQLAYWINAYNAVTIKGILREYPTSSIRNHTAWLIGYNIWKDLKLQVDRQQVSLDAMEHEILRKLGEPRIHFAIVCASVSCPKLQRWAFEAEKLDEQLTTAAEEFFADTSKNRFDASSGRVQLSQILSWFGDDFGDTSADQMRFVAKYAPATARSLLVGGRAKVSYAKYNWGLNEQK